jgi:hypothetical protein
MIRVIFPNFAIRLKTDSMIVAMCRIRRYFGRTVADVASYYRAPY